MMKNQEVFEALETLAAACPWDHVDIWVQRAPEGALLFTAIANENRELGFKFASALGNTPMEAVTQLLESESGKRDPAVSRKRRLEELQAEIERLQKVVIGMPPYRPNRELAEVNPIELPKTIDV